MHKKGRRHVRKSSLGTKRRARKRRLRSQIRQREGRERRRGRKLASVAVEIGGRKARGVIRSNPGKEFIVEAYAGRAKFYYFQGKDSPLSPKRDDATRFKNQYLARQAANYCRDCAPYQIEWFRIAPA